MNYYPFDMLLENFYILNQQDQSEGQVSSYITINPDHAIYQGHFPQQAVMPGVCMMQMVTELLATALNQPMEVQTANQIKFLIPILPEKQSKLQVDINYSVLEDPLWKVKAVIKDEEQVFFKFVGKLASHDA